MLDMSSQYDTPVCWARQWDSFPKDAARIGVSYSDGMWWTTCIDVFFFVDFCTTIFWELRSILTASILITGFYKRATFWPDGVSKKIEAFPRCHQTWGVTACKPLLWLRCWLKPCGAWVERGGPAGYPRIPRIIATLPSTRGVNLAAPFQHVPTKGSTVGQ